MQTSISQAGCNGGAGGDSAGVLYFNLRSANKHVLKIKETSVKIPGVQLPEPLMSAKITGVYKADADDEIPGVDICQVANRSGLEHLSMLSSPQEWKCVCP